VSDWMIDGETPPPCAICLDPVYFTVSRVWRHVEIDHAHDAEPVDSSTD
jgi:hypothetical protein